MKIASPSAPSTARNGRTTPLQRLLLIGLGVGLAGVLLLLAEGGLRLFGIGEDQLWEDPFVGFVGGRDVFQRVKHASGPEVYATAPEKLAFFNHQEFPVEKTPGVYRIFALGGSTTAGRPYDDRVSFSNWLRLYLPAMDSDRRWEVVNAGGISYASYRIVVLLKELVRYAPDLVVIYTGHNEFLEERSYAEIIHQNLALKRLRIWLNGLRSYSLARHWWLELGADRGGAREKLAAEVAAKLDDWTGLERYHRDDELARSVIEHFEFNLRQMVAMTRAHDIDAVIVKPVSNLKDFSPFKSEPTPALTAAEIDRRATLLSQGRDLLERGEHEAALELLQEAAAIDPDYAETHFWIGRGHLASGRLEAARAAFVRAKELDVAPLRAPERIVELVGEVAAIYGVPVVELPAILEEDARIRFGNPILGSEYFLDHVHPDIPTHSLIAEQVIQVLVQRGVVRPQPSWSAVARQALYDQLVAGLDQRYYAERDLNLAKVLGWAGKVEEAEAPLRRAVEVLPDHPEARLNLGIVLQKQGRWLEAARELEQAIELEAELPEAYFNLGVVYGRLGRPEEGVQALRRALELRPDYAEAHYNLGVLYRRQGRPQLAIDAFERALELKPGAAETYTQLGLTYRRMDRWQEASAAFRESLRLQPDQPRALAGLGGAYARQGRLDEAEALLRKALERDASNAEVHFDLAAVLRQRHRRAEAIAAYRKAIEMAPDYAEAHNNLGILLAEEGELEAASEALLRAVRIDPEYAEAYFNLGIVYDSAGLGEEAVRAIRRSLELAPETPRFHLALGLLLHARGRGREALEHLRRARRGGAEIPPQIAAWMELQ